MISHLNPSPESLKQVVARIENRCGFDAMADPEACLSDSYEAVDAIRALAAENDRLRAQVQRFREALEPFAAIADIFDSEVEGHSDTDELSLFYGDDAR